MVRHIISRPRPLGVVSNTAKQAPMRPARRATPTRTPKSKSLDEAKRLNDATGNEFFGAQLFTPEVSGELPLALDHQDLRASLGPNKWTVADTHGAFTLSGNRGGFALSQNPDIGVEQLSVSGYKNVGATGAGASYVVHSSEVNKVRLGLDAFGSQFFAGIAPSMSWSDGKGARAGLGIGLFGATNFSVRLLEAYDDPEADNYGKALVEVRRQANPGIAFDPSRAMHAIGMGAKVCLSGGQETVYRALMQQRELGEVLHRTQVNQEGVRGLIARIGAATGATQAPVAMADVQDPLNMLGHSKPLQVGEQITDTTTGSKTVGAAPGAWGLRMGFFYHRNTATACTIERLDATRINVLVAPRQVNGLSVGVDALLLADARREVSQSKTSSFGAIFDLANPKAWHAYQALMANPDAFNPEALTDVPGVQMQGNDSTDSRMLRDGAGMPRPPLPANLKIAGVGRAAVTLEQVHASTRGNVNYKTQRLVNDVQTQRLWGGEAHVRVDTRLHERQAEGDSEPALLAVSLNLTFEYDRVTGADAHYLRHALQSLSGDEIPKQSRHARGHDYQVAVGRVLSQNDFTHLTQRSPEEVARAAERFGAEAATVQAIVAGIRENHADVRTLSKHLAAANVPTLAALCYLTPNTKATVGVRSDAFNDTTTRVREFLLQDAATPLTSKDNTRNLKSIAKLQRQVDRALSQVENDTLLERYEPAARQKHLASLLWAKAALHNAAESRR